MVIVRRLLEGRRLLERDAYFSVDTKRCSVYQRAALIRGNTVLTALSLHITIYIYNYLQIFICL